MDQIPQMQVTLVFGRRLKFNSSEKMQQKENQKCNKDKEIEFNSQFGSSHISLFQSKYSAVSNFI